MEPIKWHKLTPAQRDAEIHEKVMGHARKTATHTSKTRAGDSFSYNITSWQTGGPDTPRYSRSLDDAWLVLQEMVKHSQFEEFVNHMFANSEWDSSSAQSEIYPASAMFILAAQWTPESICVAALRALGYEVVIEEASQ